MTVRGLIGIRTTEGKYIKNELEKIEEVKLVRETKNYHDVIAFVEVESMKKLSEFIFQNVRSYKDVRDTETTILIEE